MLNTFLITILSQSFICGHDGERVKLALPNRNIYAANGSKPVAILCMFAPVSGYSLGSFYGTACISVSPFRNTM